MSFSFLPPILALSLVILGGCRTHRLPELPQDRDPVSPTASETRYQPPPDVLTTELSPSGKEGTPADDEHSGHAGHREGSGRDEPGGGGAQDRDDVQKDQGGQHDGDHAHHHDGGPS